MSNIVRIEWVAIVHAHTLDKGEEHVFATKEEAKTFRDSVDHDNGRVVRRVDHTITLPARIGSR